MRFKQWMAVAVAAASIGVGCHHGPDTKGNLRKALDQGNMQQVDVKVDDNEGIVHLKGTVGSMAERSRAQEVADAVVGTTGHVLNELTVKGLNDASAGDFDRDIQKMIDNDPTLKQRDINVEVVNGMVTIKGEVRRADEKTRAGEIARAAPGV